MLPLEIIDHIFSFLSTPFGSADLDSLERCSIADPILAPIADRYFYYDISISNGGEPSSTYYRILDYTYHQMENLLFENPQIADHVRILSIYVYDLDYCQHSVSGIIPLLPIFTRLKLLALSWYARFPISTDFIAALGRCMHLPSLMNVRFNRSIPLYLLNKLPRRIKTLAFGPWYFATASLQSNPVPDTTNLQLESLSIAHTLGCGSDHPVPYVLWAKNHVRYVRSLSFCLPFHKCLLDLFAICSTTLTNLELDFLSNDFQTTYDRGVVTLPSSDMPFELSSLPHLQELTIHPNIKLLGVPGSSNYRSSLPAVIELIKTSPPLQRLVLKFWFYGFTSPTIPKIDFSSMAVFANSSFTSRQMEVRMIHCSPVVDDIPAATVLSCFVGYEELMRLYRQGVLSIPNP